MRANHSALVLALSACLAAGATAQTCEPLSAEDWATISVRNGDEVLDLLDDVRRFAALRDVDSLSDARQVLALGGLGGTCRKAKRQLLGAALNLASGRLAGDCCAEHPDGGVRPLREALSAHAGDIADGRDCTEALRFLRRVNDDGRVEACDGDARTWRGRDRDPVREDRGDLDRDRDGRLSDRADRRSDREDRDREDRDRADRERDGRDGWEDRRDEWREGDGCCRPRSRGWWGRQCRGGDFVSPAREGLQRAGQGPNRGGGHGKGQGKGQAKDRSGRGGPGAHPHLSAEERDEAVHHARRALSGLDLHPCEALDSRRLGGERGKAESEVAALALNWGAGYLDECGGGERALDGAIDALRDGRWREAWERAHRANRASGSLRRCDDDRDDGDHDEDWDDDDRRGRHESSRGDREAGDPDGESSVGDEESGRDSRGKGQDKGKGSDGSDTGEAELETEGSEAPSKGKGKGKGRSKGKGKKGADETEVEPSDRETPAPGKGRSGTKGKGKGKKG